MPDIEVEGYKVFRGPSCELDCTHFILKMEAAMSSEMMVSYHIISRCQYAEDQDLNLHSRENLKSRKTWTDRGGNKFWNILGVREQTVTIHWSELLYWFDRPHFQISTCRPVISYWDFVGYPSVSSYKCRYTVRRNLGIFQLSSLRVTFGRSECTQKTCMFNKLELFGNDNVCTIAFRPPTMNVNV
jgi:hypothetical protein